jgi:hypothetical protein
MSPLLSLERAAEVLDVEVPIVEDLIAREELYTVEIVPGLWRIAQADLRRFVHVRRRGFRPSVTEMSA